MKTAIRWVLIALTGLAFLAPLKFGAPVIVGAAVPPQSGWEWVFFSWPNQLLPIFAGGLLLWLALDWRRLPGRVDGLFLLPGLFLVTQLVAAPTSICQQTTTETLLHFAACVVIYYVAAAAVRDSAAAAWVFGGLTVGTLLVVIFAVSQHFGGLAATREYAAVYGTSISAELQLRLISNRVFGTFVYPNALAGFLVVAFAPVLAWHCWSSALPAWYWSSTSPTHWNGGPGKEWNHTRASFPLESSLLWISGVTHAPRKCWTRSGPARKSLKRNLFWPITPR